MGELTVEVNVNDKSIPRLSTAGLRPYVILILQEPQITQIENCNNLSITPRLRVSIACQD